MKKFLIVLLSVLFLTSCVTTTVVKKTEDNSQATVAVQREKINQLQKSSEDLQIDIAKIEEIVTEGGTLDFSIDMMTQLYRQKERELAAEKARSAEKDKIITRYQEMIDTFLKSVPEDNIVVSETEPEVVNEETR